MTLLIDNADLTPLPATPPISPIPADILTAEWGFTFEPDTASAGLAESFNHASLFAIDGDHILAFVGSGAERRLDLFAGGSGQSVGVMEWDAGTVFRIEVDVPNATVSVDVLEGAVTFGGGWDASDASSASKTLTPWTWSGTTLYVGAGFADAFFIPNGSILDVADENGAGPVYADGEGTAAGTSAASGALSARASLSGAASGSSAATGVLSARASLTGTAGGSSEVVATLHAIASLAGTAVGTSSATGSITDANAVVVEVPPERTYVIGPLDLTYRIDRDDRTFRVGRAA